MIGDLVCCPSQAGTIAGSVALNPRVKIQFISTARPRGLFAMRALSRSAHDIGRTPVKTAGRRFPAKYRLMGVQRQGAASGRLPALLEFQIAIAGAVDR